jgi:hypothetical protein
LYNPNGKKQKKNSNQKEHHRLTYNKTKQNTQTKQSAQRESQSRWYKRKKQIANLATPKDLID